MKFLFAAVCVVVGWSGVCLCQSPPEMGLYEKLTQGDVEALETILKTPDEYSTVILFLGAGVAFTEKKLEDSGFLFYAGQLRARFDQTCFPAKETGADSPFVLYAALSHDLGSVINPAVMAKPETFSRVIERVGKWNPKAPQEYNPGYEFKERLAEKDAEEAARPNRTEFLSRMGDLSTLLNDAKYFAAFQVLQAYNLAPDDKRPSDLENEKAMGTMRQIEKDKGLKGVFSE